MNPIDTRDMITPMTHSYELLPDGLPMSTESLESRTPKITETIQNTVKNHSAFEWSWLKSYTQKSWCRSLLDMITSLAPWVVVLIVVVVVVAG